MSYIVFLNKAVLIFNFKNWSPNIELRPQNNQLYHSFELSKFNRRSQRLLTSRPITFRHDANEQAVFKYGKWKIGHFKQTSTFITSQQVTSLKHFSYLHSKGRGESLHHPWNILHKFFYVFDRLSLKNYAVFHFKCHITHLTIVTVPTTKP